MTIGCTLFAIYNTNVTLTHAEQRYLNDQISVAYKKLTWSITLFYT